MHGHTYRVDIEVAGELTEPEGWVCDYAVIARAWAPMHEALDHRTLNDFIDNPTTEVLACWIAQRLMASAVGPMLRAVTVHESASTWARWAQQP
jgi:6-pyruvoyltetrahydropterin/6-carboxytetrahydropterin synthase